MHNLACACRLQQRRRKTHTCSNACLSCHCLTLSNSMYPWRCKPVPLVLHRHESLLQACLPALSLLDSQEQLTTGLASLLHHHFIVRQSHEDELLHSAFLMTDHLTVERILCNAACMCARTRVALMPNMQCQGCWFTLSITTFRS